MSNKQPQPAKGFLIAVCAALLIAWLLTSCTAIADALKSVEKTADKAGGLIETVKMLLEFIKEWMAKITEVINQLKEATGGWSNTETAMVGIGTLVGGTLAGAKMKKKGP